MSPEPESLRIPVDYTVVGIPYPGLRAEIRVLHKELAKLSEGVVVVLTGDTVPDHRARVVSMDPDHHLATVEFLAE